MYVARKLRENDLEAICAFPQSEEELFYMSPKFRYPLTPDQIMSLLANRFEPTVIEDSSTGQVAAYANLYDKTEELCWLGNVICSPAHRGKGAAKLLISTMMENAKHTLSAKKLILSCHNTNTRGLAFYHKLGFNPVGMKVQTLEEKKVITIQMLKEL